MADAPFIITTQIDTKGIKAGLAEIEALLVKFNPKGSFNSLINTKELDVAKSKVKQLTLELNKTKAALEKAATNTGRLATNTKKTSNALADVSRRVFVWGSMSALIFGALQNLKEFYDLTIQVNTSLAELRKVLPSDTDFGALKGEAFKLSIDFGTDPLDVLQVLKRFGQAGLSAQEAVEATRTALLALNTTGADTEQVFNAIIGANRIFGIAFEDSGRVIDKIMRLQADLAVDSKDLIASIQAIGPAITSLGGDIDDLLSNIAALAEAARVSGKEAANSLKRVLARLVSKEGITALEKLGVTVFDTAKNFRPLRDILEDVSTKYKEASQVEQQQLAVVLAQVRQYPKLIALLNNMDRQQEALAKSQNAYGDATIANQVQLDSYAKQLSIAQNQVKEFGETAILKGEIVENWVAFHQVIGDLATALTSVAGPLTKFLSLAGTAAGVIFLSKWVLQLKYSLALTAAEMKATAVAANLATRNVQIFGLAVQFTANTLRLLTGIGIAVSALFLAIEVGRRKANKEEIRYNKLIEQSTESIKKFKDSLRGIAVNNIITTDVEEKFNSLTKSLAAYTRALSIGQASTEEFVKSLGKTFGVDVSLLSEQQLKDLLETLKDVERELDPNILLPFYDVVNRGTEVMISNINTGTDEYKKFRAALAEYFEPKGIKNYADQLAELEKLEAKRRQQQLDTGRTSVYLPSDLSGTGRNLAAFIDGVKGSQESVTALWFIVSGLRRTLGLSAKSFEEVAASSGKLQDVIGRLDELNTKLTVYNDQIKRTGVVSADYKKTQQDYDDVLKGGVDIFGDLVGIQDIYKKALDGLVKSQSGAIVQIDAYSGRAKQFAVIISKLAGGFKEYAESELKSSGNAAAFAINIKEGQKAVLAMLKAIEAGKGGIFSIDFNQHAYLKAVKASTAVVLSNFEAQFKAIDVVRRVLKDTGSAFDINQQGLNTVDTALNQLNRQLGSNEEELANIKVQIQALITAQSELTNEAVREGSARTQNEETVKRLQTEMIALEHVQQQSIADYEEMVKKLLKLRNAFEQYVNESKKLATAYSSYADLFDQIIRKQISLNNLSVGGNLKKTLVENEKLYRRILAVQLQAIENEGKLLNKSQEDVKALQGKARAQAENEIILQRVAAITQDFEEGYDRVNSAVDSVRSSFADLLGDSEQFFDILTNSASGFEIIKKGVSGISDAIAKVDAEIIAKKIAEVTRKAFPKPEDVSGQLEELLQKRGPELATLIEDHLKSGGSKAASNLQEAMRLGSDHFVDKVTQGFTSAMQKVIATIRDTLKKEFAPTDQELEVTLKGADKIQELPNNLDQTFKEGGTTLQDAIKEGCKQGAEYFAFTNGVTNKTISQSDFEKLSKSFTDWRIQPDLISVVEKPNEAGSVKAIGQDKWEARLYSMMDKKQNQLISISAAALLQAQAIVRKQQEQIKSDGDLSKKDNTVRDAAFRRLGTMFAQAVGINIAKSLGKRPEDVQFGSNLGTTAGSTFGLTGALVGGIAGSILGGFFGRDKERENQEKQIQQLETISRNTAQLVDLLSPEIINAPARFVLPSGTGSAGGINITNNITTSGGSISNNDIAGLERQLEDVYVRTNRSNSPLR